MYEKGSFIYTKYMRKYPRDKHVHTYKKFENESNNIIATRTKLQHNE